MRPLLILDLIDYLYTTNLFSKIVAKELFDLEEGIIKAFAESNGISVYKNNGKQIKGWGELLKDIENASNIPEDIRKKVLKIADEFGSISVPIRTRTADFISLRDFLRNQETHYISHPSFTVARSDLKKLFSLIFELLETVDNELFESLEGTTNKVKEKFWNLYCFYNKFVLDESRIDFSKLKVEEKWLIVKGLNGKEYKGYATLEVGVWELIEKIENGEWRD